MTYTSAEAYREHCPVCRTFGSTYLKGRCSIRDAFPWLPHSDDLDEGGRANLRRANQTEVRHGVAINRVTGAAQGGQKFEAEVVPPGALFWSEIEFENYELWQLGMLATAIEELDEGYATIGAGKTKGMGVVRATVAGLIHDQRGSAVVEFAGLAPLVSSEVIRDYGLLDGAATVAAEGIPRALGRRFLANSPAEARAILEASRSVFDSLRMES